jgi:hypothetical protein
MKSGGELWRIGLAGALTALITVVAYRRIRPDRQPQALQGAEEPRAASAERLTAAAT